MSNMGVTKKWFVECDFLGCTAGFGPFDTEREATDHVKYSDECDGWQVTEQDWAFGASLYTYCPDHHRDTPDAR